MAGRFRGDNWGSQKNLHDRAPSTYTKPYNIWDVSEDCEDKGIDCPPGYGGRRSKSSNKPKKSAKRAKTAKRSKSRKIRRQRK